MELLIPPFFSLLRLTVSPSDELLLLHPARNRREREKDVTTSEAAEGKRGGIKRGEMKKSVVVMVAGRGGRKRKKLSTFTVFPGI